MAKKKFNPYRGFGPSESASHAPVLVTAPSGEKYWRTPNGELIRNRSLGEGYPGGRAAEQELEHALKKLFGENSKSTGWTPVKETKIFTPVELTMARKKVEGLLAMQGKVKETGDPRVKTGLKDAVEVAVGVYNEVRQRWGLKPVGVKTVYERGLPVDEVAAQGKNKRAPAIDVKTQEELKRIAGERRAILERAGKPASGKAAPLNPNEMRWVRNEIIELLWKRMMGLATAPIAGDVLPPLEVSKMVRARKPAQRNEKRARWERVLVQRFSALTLSRQRDALSLLRVAKKLLDIERKVWGQGNYTLASRCERDHGEAMNAFWSILNQTPKKS